MRILFLTNLLPYPLDNGGKIKSYNVINILSNAGHTIDLLCFDEKDEKHNNFEAELLNICRYVHQIHLKLTTANHKKYMIKKYIQSLFSKLPFNIYKYKSKDMYEKLHMMKNAGNDYDIIYIDHLPISIYIECTKKLWPKARVVLDEHNCEYIILERNSEQNSNILKKWIMQYEAKKEKIYEANAVRNSDDVIVLSSIDYSLIKKAVGEDFPHKIIPISVQDKAIKKINNINNAVLNILFIGTLTWEPNNQGLIWFLKNVVPKMRKEKIEFHLYIVGKHPSKEVVELASNKTDITITGYVDSIDEYYDKCDCTVVPLFIGSGQRVKLIESFSKGMPAISTLIGAEGLVFKDKDNLLIANNPDEFLCAIKEMQNPDVRKRIGEKARKTFEDVYSIEAISNSYKDVIY